MILNSHPSYYPIQLSWWRTIHPTPSPPWLQDKLQKMHYTQPIHTTIHSISPATNSFSNNSPLRSETSHLWAFSSFQIYPLRLRDEFISSSLVLSFYPFSFQFLFLVCTVELWILRKSSFQLFLDRSLIRIDLSHLIAVSIHILLLIRRNQSYDPRSVHSVLQAGINFNPLNLPSSLQTDAHRKHHAEYSDHQRSLLRFQNVLLLFYCCIGNRLAANQWLCGQSFGGCTTLQRSCRTSYNLRSDQSR